MPTWVTRHQTFALLPGPLCLDPSAFLPLRKPLAHSPPTPTPSLALPTTHPAESQYSV